MVGKWNRKGTGKRKVDSSIWRFVGFVGDLEYAQPPMSRARALALSGAPQVAGEGIRAIRSTLNSAAGRTLFKSRQAGQWRGAKCWSVLRNPETFSKFTVRANVRKIIKG